MRAALYDASFVEHANLVGVLDGGEAVGDGDGGARLHQALEGFLHEAFALGVECRSGFVKNEDVGVLQDGACNGNALAPLFMNVGW